MNTFARALLFSFLVAVGMVMLDALYHLATETAVHINYVAVKFALIFLTVFLTSWWTGIGLNQGIFATITGPVIFYIYYRAADSTLNRELFTIDEGFGYIFLHIAVFMLSYALVFRLLQRSGTPLARNAGLAALFALTAAGLDAAYQLEKVQLITKNEEIVARVLHFDTTLYLVLALLLAAFLCYHFIRSAKLQAAALVIGSALLLMLIGKDIPRALAGILTAGIPVLLLQLVRSPAWRAAP